MEDMRKSKHPIGGLADKLALPALTLGTVLTALAFLLAFTVASPVMGAKVNGVELIGDEMIGNQILLSQKIFYFHMPVAVTSMVVLAGTAFFAIRFLMTRDALYDLKAKICTELALVFVICTMITGDLWTRFEWGVWWTWEPRLTTYLILTLMVIAYFILRAAVDEPERRATFASVFSIIMFIDVPISFMITRLIPSSVHPVILRTDSGLSPDMLAPMLCALFGFSLISYGLYRFRTRTEIIGQRVDVLKEALDNKLGN
ncbi:MAG: cytochrome c biogenesis protein CcsA [Eggerthellaceae bacterium]|nr:cytochrome c biogenesis protein CcsA [Eggerthellaceae bacterium]